MSKAFKRLKEIFNASLIVRLLTAVANFLDGQWEKSYLAELIAGAKEKTGEASVFNKAEGLINRAWVKLFRALRLDRLFEGSIFTRTFFWVALTAGIAPIAPTMVTLAAALVAVFSLIVTLGRGERKLLYAPINKWIYAYALVYLFCTLTSVNVASNLRGGALTLVFIIFPIVLINTVTKRSEVEALTVTLVVSGFIVSAYGIFQMFFGAQNTASWIDESFTEEISLRVYSTLENPNVLSEYLLLVIPMGAVTVLTAKNINGRLAAIIATGAMVVCMLFTYSRGGWLGLIFSAAIFLVILDRRFIPLGILAMAVLFFVLPEAVISRFSSIGNMADTSTNYRLSIWVGTIEMLKDYWLTGVGTGIEAFRNIYPVYSQHSALAQHSHSLYLQIMSEMGVAGAITFLGVICCTVRQSASKLRRTADRDTRFRLAALISGLGGFLLQSATDYSFYNYRVTLVFWIFIGLGAAICRLPNAEESEAAAE